MGRKYERCSQDFLKQTDTELLRKQHRQGLGWMQRQESGCWLSCVNTYIRLHEVIKKEHFLCTQDLCNYVRRCVSVCVSCMWTPVMGCTHHVLRYLVKT